MSVIIALSIYFLALVIISWYSRHAAKSQAFVLGERKVGLLGTMASQAVGSMDGSGIVIFTMFGLLYGFGAAWVIVGVLIGFGLLSWQGPRIREIAIRHNVLNINDFLAAGIGPLTEKLSIVVTMITLWLATAGQLYVTGLIFHSATGWPPWVGVLLGGGAVMLYTIVGGYVTLVRTDLFQWVAATIIFSAALVFGHPPSLHTSWIEFRDISADWKWGFVLLPVFVYYATPETWQRIFSARDAKVARYGPALVIPVHTIYLLACIALGTMISVQVSKTDALSAFYRYLSSAAVPAWAAGALAVVAMAMIMSTLDTRAYCFISMVIKNLMHIDPEAHLEKFVRRTRMTTFIYFAVSMLVAIFISDIVQYMLNVCTVFAILGPALFIACYSNARMKYLDKVMFAVIMFGIGIFLIMSLNGQMTSLLMTVTPVIITALLTSIAYGALCWQENRGDLSVNGSTIDLCQQLDHRLGVPLLVSDMDD